MTPTPAVRDLRAVRPPARRIDAARLAAVPVTDLRPRPLGDVRAALGERPVWDAASDALVWVDIDGAAVHRWPGGDPRRARVTRVPSQVGVAWPTASGGLLLATADGIGVHDGDRLGPLTRPAGMPDDYRFNDGGCDPAGRFWVSTMPRDGSAGDGTVYRVTWADGGVVAEPALTGVGCGNGLAWSPDGGTLVLTDSGTGTLHRAPYDVGTGQVGPVEAVLGVDVAGVVPDGTAVDAEGCLWVALYGGGRVLRLGPDGEPLGSWSLPTARVTCPGFGPAGSGRLYVTTAGEAGPAGAVFALAVDVDGLPVPVFADA